MKKIAEGWTSEIFTLSTDQVIKLYKPGFEGLAHVEFAKTKYLKSYLATVPEVFEMVEFEGRKGYSMERLYALPIGSITGLNPNEIARVLAELLLTFYKIPTNELFNSIQVDIENKIEQKMDLLGNMGATAKMLLAKISASSNFCHGDYHTGNVVVCTGKQYIIDWNRSGTGDLNADIAKTLILMLFGPPGLALSVESYKERKAICRAYIQYLKDANVLNEDNLCKWVFIRMVEFMILPLPVIHKGIEPFLMRWMDNGNPDYEEMLL